MVANPALLVVSQLIKQKNIFLFISLSLLVRAWDFVIARQVRPYRLASACSFSTLRLSLVLTHRIPPACPDGTHSVNS